MQILFVINDPPYGTERTYNALRHANAVAIRPEVSVKIFFWPTPGHVPGAANKRRTGITTLNA